MSEHWSEEQLGERAIQGNAIALQTLMLVHWRRLDSYVDARLPQVLRGVFEPRDILQDVFRLAFRRIAGFKADGEDAAFRWFVTIARNRMAELLRTTKAVKRGGDGAQWLEALGDVPELLGQLGVSYRTPSKSAIRHELVQKLETALDHLPMQYQQALRLRFFEELTFGQIAVRMSRTEASAQMLCSRGLKRLRVALVSASRYA